MLVILRTLFLYFQKGRLKLFHLFFFKKINSLNFCYLEIMVTSLENPFQLKMINQIEEVWLRGLYLFTLLQHLVPLV